jgi:hypothetical protein
MRIFSSSFRRYVHNQANREPIDLRQGIAAVSPIRKQAVVIGSLSLCARKYFILENTLKTRKKSRLLAEDPIAK